MSNKQNTTTPTTKVTISKVVLTVEQLAQIDSILGNLPYKSVRVIYDILESAMIKEAEDISQQQTQKTPNLTPATEEDVRGEAV